MPQALFDKWNSHAHNNNCYAFAFNHLVPDASEKLQPGDLSGWPAIPRADRYSCDDLLARVQADYPATLIIEPNEHVEGAGHRVALFVDDDGELRDYHFYREMPDGTWWHKPGSLPVSKVDNSGNVITNPLTANRDYTRDGDETSNYNYETFCAFLWVPEMPTPKRTPRALVSVLAVVALVVALALAAVWLVC